MAADNKVFDMTLSRISEPYRVGDTFYNDCVIETFVAKTEVNKTKTSLRPGDVVVLIEKSGDASCGVIEKASATNVKTNTVLGVVTSGAVGYHAPVITKGHCVVNVDSAVIANASVGSALVYGPDGGKCCKGVITHKIKSVNFSGGKPTDNYVINLK